MGRTEVVVVQDNIGLAKSTGLFSAPPPLCVTEPYKGPDRIAPRFKGKQIATGYLKHDKSAFAPGTFNAPLLLWSESKDQFKDGTHYKDVFPPDKKKNGFGSSDFPKRDEYSDTKKTCQLRETLKKEGKKEREARDATDVRVVDYQTRMPGTGAHLTSTQILMQSTATTIPSPPLYDIVYRVPEASLRLARDDRQARFYYQTERVKMMKTMLPPAEPAQVSRWYNIQVDGKHLMVLVNPHGQVTQQKLLGAQ